MFKKRIKKSRATWLGLLLRKGNSRSRSRKHQSERGIAIPLVIGIGLLMMLLSITVIVRSQSSQVNTSNLKQAATANEVAEAGVATVQGLFGQYRQLPRITLENISNSPNVTTWTNASGIFPAGCGASVSTTSNYLNKIRKNEWIQVIGDSSGFTRQFRVVSYTYSLIPKTPAPTTSSSVTTSATLGSTALSFSPSTLSSSVSIAIPVSNYLLTGTSVYGQLAGVPGTLSNSGGSYKFTLAIAPAVSTTVDIPASSIFYPISNAGGNNDKGTGNLIVEGQILSGTTVVGTSGLQIQIPVSPGDIVNTPIPGAWIGVNYQDNNNQSFDANVLVSCNATATDLVNNLAAGRTIVKSELKIPSPPDTPTTNICDISGFDFSGSGASNLNLPVTTYSGVNCYDSTTQTYRYKAVNINTDAKQIIVDSRFRVDIFMSGNMDGDIISNSDATFTSNFSVPTSNNVTVALTKSDYLIDGQSLAVILNNKVGSNTVTIPGTLARIGSTYTFTPTTYPSSAISISRTSDFFEPASIPAANFRLYGTAPAEILPNLTVSTQSPYICIKGNNRLRAFVLAPNYTFGVSGGGVVPAGDGVIFGTIWTAYYNTKQGCTSSSNKVIVYQNGTWDDVGLSPVNLPPTIQSNLTWIKKEKT